jgi:enoyl-[acyl-carrier protein] reductase II
MKTRITEMFDIELPVMLAGMGGVSYSDLVAAVSEAGGIGTFGAAPMSTELLISEMARVRDEVLPAYVAIGAPGTRSM